MSREIGLVIIGNELLTGKRQDKHLSRLTEIVAAKHLEISWVRMIGDREALITQTFRETMASEAIVFSFGGIGATPDDLTRPCAAKAAGRPIVRHPEFVSLLEDQFGADAYPHRVRMAEIPEGSALIPNPVNNIPGFSLGSHHFLPGFPSMAWPMAEWVLDNCYPDLLGLQLVENRLRVFDTPESQLIPAMEAVLHDWPQLDVSCLPTDRAHNDEPNARREIDLGIKGPKVDVQAATKQFMAALDASAIGYASADE